MDNSKTLILACATVIEEILPLMPSDMKYEVLDFGLHVNPNQLRHILQETIDGANSRFDTIILGYGLCSQAIIGIKASCCTLVIPRVDDCIAIFLGSSKSYQNQLKTEPGTYYLTKGWIEVGDSPFAQYEKIAAKQGKERADRIMRLMLKNYTRLALINTGRYGMDHYREYARKTAQQFGLRYEEIMGSTTLIQKMVAGNWDNDFIIIPVGETVQYSHFYPDLHK
ncbi:MAG: DUF1638 domain-containing protein [Anaerolineales bacterium]|nr:DUF1638 domain-containing protein [Anaerolineales bacterium]